MYPAYFTSYQNRDPATDLAEALNAAADEGDSYRVEQLASGRWVINYYCNNILEGAL